MYITCKVSTGQQTPKMGEGKTDPAGGDTDEDESSDDSSSVEESDWEECDDEFSFLGTPVSTLTSTKIGGEVSRLGPFCVEIWPVTKTSSPSSCPPFARAAVMSPLLCGCACEAHGLCRVLRQKLCTDLACC